MKRSEMIKSLKEQGLTESTLVKFNDKQITNLYERFVPEQITPIPGKPSFKIGEKGGTLPPNAKGYEMSTDPLDKRPVAKPLAEKDAKGVKRDDQVKQGAYDGRFKTKVVKDKKKEESKNWAKKKTEMSEMIRFYDDDGNEIKDKKGKLSPTSTKDKDFDEKVKGKKKEDDKSNKDIKESKPSAGLSKEKKSEIVKKAKKGEDIGKKGKGFEKIEKKAKESGAKDPKAVAAAAMWKNVKRKNVNETKIWIKRLAENNYHTFTSKNEIMELIQTKINEVEVGPNVKKGHNGIPEFMTYDSIKKSDVITKQDAMESTTTKPKTKPKTTPTTKPGDKPKTPYQPGPGKNPKPKALKESK